MPEDATLTVRHGCVFCRLNRLFDCEILMIPGEYLECILSIHIKADEVFHDVKEAGLLKQSYLFWNLANRYEELRAISDSSSIRGSLTTKMIAAFEIPCANNDVIQTFSGFAWAVIPQIENNLLENERLAALRDSLLPKLMTGEIDVSAIQL